MSIIISVQTQQIDPALEKLINDSNLEWVKCINPSKTAFAKKKRTMRVPLDDGYANNFVIQGAAGALPYFNACAQTYAECNRPGDIWEGPNEPPCTDRNPDIARAKCQALDAFTVEWAHIMHDHGYLVGGLVFSTGCPEFGNAHFFVKSVRAVEYVMFHTYGPLRIDTSAPYYSTRYKSFLQELSSIGVEVPRVMLTEAGIDQGLVPNKSGGWQAVPTSAEDFWNQMCGYNDLIIPDARVKAIFFFLLGSTDPRWNSFGLEPIMPWLLRKAAIEGWRGNEVVPPGPGPNQTLQQCFHNAAQGKEIPMNPQAAFYQYALRQPGNWIPMTGELDVTCLDGKTYRFQEYHRASDNKKFAVYCEIPKWNLTTHIAMEG